MDRLPARLPDVTGKMPVLLRRDGQSRVLRGTLPPNALLFAITFESPICRIGETQLLIDIGGQDSKAVRLDANGQVTDFAL